MSVEAFCYIGLRKDPQGLSRIISLLAEPRQEEARRFLAEVKNLGPDELNSRLGILRQADVAALRDRAAWTGVPLERLPPGLLAVVLARALENMDGREDR